VCTEARADRPGSSEGAEIEIGVPTDIRVEPRSPLRDVIALVRIATDEGRVELGAVTVSCEQ
jgi:hypothetical protein